MAKREANNARELEAEAQRRATDDIRAGYLWVLPKDFHEPVGVSPCCGVCGAVVPLRMQGLHTAWHQS